MNTCNKSFDIVLFHYPCQDGLTSGWIADHYHKTHNQHIELYPIQHGTLIEYSRLENKKVLFCDYAPSLEILNELEKIATTITILDHHISAKKALENKSYAVFDMNKSGAGLTWSYFYPDTQTPDFIQMVQDRDIWTWKLPNSRPFTAGLYTLCQSCSTYEFDEIFKIFDNFFANAENVTKCIELGTIIDKVNMNKANNIAKGHVEKIDRWREYNVCIVNCFADLASDLGDIIGSNLNVDFVVLWNYNHPTGEYRISLRSKNKVDVSKIAQEFGGGGHVNASGFATKINPINLFTEQQPITL
jgi:oligoribonuclease NrnB/cAMP/cGMP phosphodiesterase (DHH superfamily)